VEAKLPVRVGLITHYYPHVDAGIVRIERGEIKVGDTLHVRGHTTDFYQRVDRMELDRQPVQSARAGQEVGIHMSQRVRDHDEVFLVPS
jgi:putative protease